MLCEYNPAKGSFVHGLTRAGLGQKLIPDGMKALSNTTGYLQLEQIFSLLLG